MKPRPFAVVLFAMTAIAGCGPAPKPPASAVLSVGHVAPADHHYQAALEHFARLLGTRTRGRLELRIFSNAQKGSEEEMVQQVRDGNLSMALVSSTAVGTIDPALLTLDLPYLFEDRATAYAVLDGRFGKRLAARLTPLGIRNLAWWEHGFVDIANRTRSAATPQQLKGLRLCVPKSTVAKLTVEAFGATPVPALQTQVGEILAKRQADGRAAPLALIEADDSWRGQRYVTVTRHVYQPAVLIIGTLTYTGLHADVRRVLDRAAVEARGYARQLAADAEKAAEADLAARNIAVNRPDLARFREATRPVGGQAREALAARLSDGPEFVDAALAAASSARR